MNRIRFDDLHVIDRAVRVNGVAEYDATAALSLAICLDREAWHAWIEALLSPAIATEAVDDTAAALAAMLAEVDSACAAVGPNTQIPTAMQTDATFMTILRDRPRHGPIPFPATVVPLYRTEGPAFGLLQ